MEKQCGIPHLAELQSECGRVKPTELTKQAGGAEFSRDLRPPAAEGILRSPGGGGGGGRQPSPGEACVGRVCRPPVWGSWGEGDGTMGWGPFRSTAVIWGFTFVYTVLLPFIQMVFIGTLREVSASWFRW